MTAALTAESITVRFGGLTAVDGVSAAVAPAAVTVAHRAQRSRQDDAVQRPLRAAPARGGRVLIGDRDVTTLGTHDRARLGMGRTFQRLEVFTGMTVFENLQVARRGPPPGPDLHRGVPPAAAPDDPAVLDERRADHRAARPRPVARRRSPAALSTGLLRLVELGRALCTDPTVLLLDEPGSGLDPARPAALQGVLERVAGDGAGILLIEHDVELVMALSSRIYVLDFGKLIAEGTPDEISHDSAVAGCARAWAASGERGWAEEPARSVLGSRPGGLRLRPRSRCCHGPRSLAVPAGQRRRPARAQRRRQDHGAAGHLRTSPARPGPIRPDGRRIDGRRPVDHRLPGLALVPEGGACSRPRPSTTTCASPTGRCRRRSAARSSSGSTTSPTTFPGARAATGPAGRVDVRR